MKRMKIFIAVVVILMLAGCENNETESVYFPSAHEEKHEALSPPQVETSEFGRQAAEKFLSAYLSLFSFGYKHEGVYRNYPDGSELSMRPLVLWGQIDEPPWNIYLDRYGNRIEDSSFVADGEYAAAFLLYDLDDDDIPEIIIHWVLPESCGYGLEIFKFIDGEYRDMGFLKGWHKFFYDDTGRIVVLYDDDKDGKYAYYYLNFTDDEIEHEEIPIGDFTWEQWRAHHGGEEFATAPTIFGTEISLTRIHPLTELREEITSSVKQKLGVFPEHEIFHWLD
jgi:hypothetical protein